MNLFVVLALSILGLATLYKLVKIMSGSDEFPPDRNA